MTRKALGPIAFSPAGRRAASPISREKETLASAHSYWFAATASLTGMGDREDREDHEHDDLGVIGQGLEGPHIVVREARTRGDPNGVQERQDP